MFQVKYADVSSGEFTWVPSPELQSRIMSLPYEAQSSFAEVVEAHIKKLLYMEIGLLYSGRDAQSIVEVIESGLTLMAMEGLNILSD